MNLSHVVVREDWRGTHLASSMAIDCQLRGSFLRMRYRDGFRLVSSIIRILCESQNRLTNVRTRLGRLNSLSSTSILQDLRVGICVGSRISSSPPSQSQSMKDCGPQALLSSAVLQKPR